MSTKYKGRTYVIPALLKLYCYVKVDAAERGPRCLS